MRKLRCDVDIEFVFTLRYLNNDRLISIRDPAKDLARGREFDARCEDSGNAAGTKLPALRH